MTKRVYWYRELPPLEEAPESEHVVEARSEAVAYRRAEEASMRRECEASLERNAARRIEQELDRLGGTCARVISREIEARHDQPTETYVLKGTYTFVLYRRPALRAA